MSAGDETARKPSHFRRWILLISGLTAILLVLAATFYQWRTPVRGGLRLGAEPDVEVYVGDQLVGVGGAFVTWSEVFGWTGDQPLGIVLSPEARDVPRVGNSGPRFDSLEWVGEATANRLAGEGATVVGISYGNPPLASYAGRHRYARKELLLRLPDGTLDQVFCLDLQLISLWGERYRALVPIRLRAPQGDAARYFSTDRRGGGKLQGDEFGLRDGSSYTRVVLSWSFATAESPPEVAATGGHRGTASKSQD